MRYKQNGMILLNYTGEIVKLNQKKKNEKLSIKHPVLPNGRTSMILPPLGKASVISELKQEATDVFPTMHYKVSGLPEPIPEAFFIVNNIVAKTLSRYRNDLLILCEPKIIKTKNLLKPDEVMLECSNFAHVFIEI